MRVSVRVRSRSDRKHLQLAYRHPRTGELVTRSAGTDNWRKAERAAQALEQELAETGGVESISWDRFRTRFEDEHLAHLKPATAAQYIYALDRFEREMGHPRRLESITASTLSEFAHKLLPAMSQASVRSKLKAVKTALNWAVKMDMMQKAPAIMVPLRSGSRGRPLTHSEVLRYFATIRHVVPADRRQAVTDLVKLMWLGGLRLGEARRLSLSCGSVRADLDSATPSIIWKAEGHKAGREEATCIPPDLFRFLSRQPRSRRTVVDLKGVSDRQLKGWLSDIGRRAEIRVSDKKWATAHDFRRTFGTRWALRVHPLALKHMMRHREISTTLRFYVNLDEAQVGRTVWESVHASVHDPRLRQKPPA